MDLYDVQNRNFIHMKCSVCHEEGHIATNTKFHPKKISAVSLKKDKYTKEILEEQYQIHKTYVERRMESSKRVGIQFRLPSIPEDITENIVKFIIHKLGDTTTTWDCTGDLQSEKEGKQECKSFTSDGPLSFTPSSEWDCIYFLDVRGWLNNTFRLWKVSLKRTSEDWKNIKINKTQTFEDQCKQGRRPRITWNGLYPQLGDHCIKVFEGSFEDIFTLPLKEEEPVALQ